MKRSDHVKIVWLPLLDSSQKLLIYILRSRPLQNPKHSTTVLSLYFTLHSPLKCSLSRIPYILQNLILFSTSSKAVIAVYLTDSIPTCSLRRIKQKRCCYFSCLNACTSINTFTLLTIYQPIKDCRQWMFPSNFHFTSKNIFHIVLYHIL